MRIVITEAAGLNPVVLDGMKAVILAADNGRSDNVPCIAHGDPHRLAELAAVILNSIRLKLGEQAFEAVVKGARSLPRVQDITNALRSAPEKSR